MWALLDQTEPQSWYNSNNVPQFVSFNQHVQQKMKRRVLPIHCPLNAAWSSWPSWFWAPQKITVKSLNLKKNVQTWKTIYSKAKQKTNMNCSFFLKISNSNHNIILSKSKNKDFFLNKDYIAQFKHFSITMYIF